jgi:hypothetical protein
MLIPIGGELPGRAGWRQIWGIRTRLRRYGLAHQENYSTCARGSKIYPHNTKRRLKGLSHELDWASDGING